MPNYPKIRGKGDKQISILTKQTAEISFIKIQLAGLTKMLFIDNKKFEVTGGSLMSGKIRELSRRTLTLWYAGLIDLEPNTILRTKFWERNILIVNRN